VKRLIINADDFGLTAGVNRAIVELHRAGVLTSATVMARAAATDQAVGLALSETKLGVGCHVVLVDGAPVLDAQQLLPHLADRITCRFAPTLGRFLRQLRRGQRGFLRRDKISAEIEAEAHAQIRLVQSRGIRLTHIDTHKHTHMFPTVLRAVLRGAKAAGISVVRNPFEPEWSVRATASAPLLRQLQVRLLRSLYQGAFHRIVREEGFATTDGAAGVLATGTLDAATLASLLQAMPEGTWELVTHPGYNDADLAGAGTRLLASRKVELEALRAAAFASDVELIHFGQIVGN